MHARYKQRTPVLIDDMAGLAVWKQREDTLQN